MALLSKALVLLFLPAHRDSSRKEKIAEDVLNS
jgi:hypothetical protein